MHQVRILLLASSLVLPGAAVAAEGQAQPVAALPSERRLSPDQIETILDDAQRKRELARSSEERLPPSIQGEIGFSIGTGGHRSAFGTAIVPLPGEGAAILSLGTGRFEPDGDVYYRER